ncbi:hypothetical protein P5673_005552 [Acropora cervicornis]|uniref:Uncharacterized protein n=1 Tax=Acropora cervicornis TaxID=6130 RepID=A0AAD9VCT0_ACRCE|nr:hypothetical protein P5673_005552 [Acropora cervicornis]
MDYVLLTNNNNSQVSKKTDLESVNTKLKALSSERGKMIDDVSVSGPAVGCNTQDKETCKQEGGT